LGSWDCCREAVGGRTKIRRKARKENTRGGGREKEKAGDWAVAVGRKRNGLDKKKGRWSFEG